MSPLSELPPNYDPKQDKIEIVPYDPQWPEEYLKEETALKRVLGEFPGLRIAHCGSTAVPGLAAKPIIDIILSVDSPDQWPRLIEPIESLGYFYWATNPDKDTLYFAKGMPPFGTGRTHHVHVYDRERDKEIRFRDFLRTHPETAKEYGSLKRELAAKFTYDRKGYTDAKTEFIESVLKETQ